MNPRPDDESPTTRPASSSGTTPPSPASSSASEESSQRAEGGDASVEDILRQLSRLGDGDRGFGEGSPVLEAAKTVKTQQTQAVMAMRRATEALNRLREALAAGASGRQEASEALSRELRRIKSALDGKQDELVEDAERLLKVLNGNPTGQAVTGSLRELGAALDQADAATKAAADQTARQQARDQEDARRRRAEAAIGAQRDAQRDEAEPGIYRVQDAEDQRIAARQEEENENIRENIRNAPATRAELDRMGLRGQEVRRNVAQDRDFDGRANRGGPGIFEQLGMAARPGTTTRRRTGGKRRPPQRGGWQNTVTVKKKRNAAATPSPTRKRKKPATPSPTRRRRRKRPRGPRAQGKARGE